MAVAEIYDTPDELQSSYPQHDFGAWGAGFTAGIVSGGCSTIVAAINN